MRETFVRDTADNITCMSVEERVLLLRYIGMGCYQYQCMTETLIWKVARKFNEQSGYNSKRGLVSTLELLLKALKECDAE